jgi:hypothetical protein
MMIHRTILSSLNCVFASSAVEREVSVYFLIFNLGPLFSAFLSLFWVSAGVGNEALRYGF